MKILLKTYKNDIKRAILLLNDLSKFSDIETFVVSDNKTLSLLKSKIDHKNFFFISEEILFNEKESVASGYIQQQIVKIKFSNIINSDYFCIDSDCRIIKKLSISTFYDKSNNLYDFVDIDCIVENFTSWNNQYFNQRNNYLSFIRNIYNIDAFPTSHGLCSLNYQIVNEMLKYFKENEYDLLDLLKKAPMEFSWYYGFISLINHPLFVHKKPILSFHTHDDYCIYKKYSSFEIIKKNYIGYNLNSTWSDKSRILNFNNKNLIKNILGF